MRPVVVLRHEDPDHLALGAEVLQASGLTVEYLDVWRGATLPAPDDLGGLVLLGGSMGVADHEAFPFLGAEQELIRTCEQRAVPLLGLCLGAQLLAAALGGHVSRAPRRSLGFLPVERTGEGAVDPLFHQWCATDRVFRWHEDTFTLPPGADLLMSAVDIPNQAFRFGKCAWGVQFHMELDRPLLDAWIASSGESIRSNWGADPDEILHDASIWLPHQQAHAREAFKSFAVVVHSRESVRRQDRLEA